MKKQTAFALLGLMTLAGGSWLAAQQRDSIRTSSPYELPPLIELAEEAGGARPAEVPQKARRPAGANSATSPVRASPRQRSAQDPRPPAESYYEEAARYPEVAREFYDLSVAGQKYYTPGMQQRMTSEDAARMRSFQEAIRELRKAESADEKSAARDRVTKLVSEQLEVDLANREKELVAIEQRAKELRKQLEERKTAKPELLKMLVMLIDNPQVGLGIPPEWMQMLMRGQSDLNRQGFPIDNAFLVEPRFGDEQPPQRAAPPAALPPSIE